MTRTSFPMSLGLLDGVVGPVSGMNVIHGLSVHREIHGNHRELKARPSLDEENMKIIAQLEQLLVRSMASFSTASNCLDRWLTSMTDIPVPLKSV